MTIMTPSPKAAWSYNLPPSNGATYSKTGTVETLLPILKMKSALLQIQDQCISYDSNRGQSFRYNNDDDSDANQRLLVESIFQQIQTSIPTQEKAFKKIFDEYSDPITYKQKYMDQNAFLIYYTKGFDGFGRPSIEDSMGVEIEAGAAGGTGGTPTYTRRLSKQTLQYSARNEIWIAFEEFYTELEYIRKEQNSKTLTNSASQNIQELIPLLHRTLQALDVYLNLDADVNGDRNK